MLFISSFYALYGNSYKFVCWSAGGFILGFLVAHTVPGICKRMGPDNTAGVTMFGGCRCCFFSWDTLRKPVWALDIENHVLLHHVLGIVTYNRTNCLSALYQDPSWGKTFAAVKDKLLNRTACN